MQAKDACPLMQQARAKGRAAAFNSACETAATKPPCPKGDLGYWKEQRLTETLQVIRVVQ